MVGSAMIILAGGSLGLMISHGYGSRPRQLRSIRSGLQMLETEIAFALTPLPDALKKIGDIIGGQIGSFFSSVGISLDGDSSLSSGEIWERELSHLRENAFLTQTDFDILLCFGRTLGASDRDDQTKNLRLVQEQLLHQEAAAERLKEGNQRMWRTVGFLAGLAVVFILY